MLFLAIFSVDLLTTVFSATSQKALIMATGGVVFSGTLTILWIIILVGLLFTIATSWRGPAPAEPKNKFIASTLLQGSMFLYGSMLVLAIINPLAAWPLLFQFLTMIAWAGILLYFRQVSVIE
jgi:hypothetical protein